MRSGGGVVLELTVAIVLSFPLMIWGKEKGGERRNDDPHKVRGGDQISPARAPRSTHIGRSVSRSVICVPHLHRRRGAASASGYPCTSPAQYLTLTRVWMTSSSKGKTCLKTYVRAEGGSIVASAPKRLVASVEDWLKRRRRAREERRRDQSCERKGGWVRDVGVMTCVQ